MKNKLFLKWDKNFELLHVRKILEILKKEFSFEFYTEYNDFFLFPHLFVCEEDNLFAAKYYGFWWSIIIDWLWLEFQIHKNVRSDIDYEIKRVE